MSGADRPFGPSPMLSANAKDQPSSSVVSRRFVYKFRGVILSERSERRIYAFGFKMHRPFATLRVTPENVNELTFHHTRMVNPEENRCLFHKRSAIRHGASPNRACRAYRALVSAHASAPWAECFPLVPGCGPSGPVRTPATRPQRGRSRRKICAGGSARGSRCASYHRDGSAVPAVSTTPNSCHSEATRPE